MGILLFPNGKKHFMMYIVVSSEIVSTKIKVSFKYITSTYFSLMLLVVVHSSVALILLGY